MRYYERHVWIHKVEGPNGLQEIKEDREDQFELTQEGAKKAEELETLLSHRCPSLSTRTMVMACGLLFLAYVALLFSAPDPWGASVVYLAFGIPILLAIRVWHSDWRKIIVAKKHDTLRAPTVSRFVDENPDFIRELQKMQPQRVEEALHLAELHRQSGQQ